LFATLIWLRLNLCIPGIHKFKSVYAKAYTAYTVAYSEETGRGHSPPRPILAVLNAHPSTASVPINVPLGTSGSSLTPF